MSSLVAFRRIANAPPPERELLEVDDAGRATAWRSNGKAIGRFAGTVPDADGLRAAVEAAAAAEPPGPVELPPDAAAETVEAGGRTATFEARMPAGGPWGELLESCRRLADALVDQPVAAIGATVEGDGRVRLEHRGTEPLPVELASLRADLALWRDGREASKAGAAAGGLGRVEAGPGWSTTIDVPGLDASGGGILVARVSFVAEDGGILVPVVITISRRR